jgi:hypothetical protein
MHKTSGTKIGTKDPVAIEPHVHKVRRDLGEAGVRIGCLKVGSRRSILCPEMWRQIKQTLQQIPRPPQPFWALKDSNIFRIPMSSPNASGTIFKP